MANHPSAIKRARQNIKRRARNKHVAQTCRTLVKKAREAIDGKDAAVADTVASAVQSLSAAGSKGVIHKRQASRRISRLMKAAHAAKA